MATFERARRTLRQAVGRRLMAWGLKPREPAAAAELPARLWWRGRPRVDDGRLAPRWPPGVARWTAGAGAPHRWWQALVRSPLGPPFGSRSPRGDTRAGGTHRPLGCRSFPAPRAGAVAPCPWRPVVGSAAPHPPGEPQCRHGSIAPGGPAR